MKIKSKRNAKFWGLQFSPEFLADIDKTLIVCDNLVAHFRQRLQNGEIVEITRFGIHLNKEVEITSGKRAGQTDTYLTAAEYNNAVIPHLYDVEDKKSLKRQILFYVMERFMSYFKRNKLSYPYKKIPSTVISKDKSFYYKESQFIEVDLDNSKLIVKTLYGTHDVPFRHHLKGELVTLKDEKDKLPKTGGNFALKQRAFVAAVDKEVEIQYEPTSIKAYDQNKTPSEWLAFNDGKVLPMSDEMQSIVGKITQRNLIINEKSKPVDSRNYRSEKRRSQRKDLQKLHSDLNSEIKKVAHEIINDAVKNKQLLCIDSVKTGHMNGTFGQDHLPKILQTECENKGIPFYVVPCKGTSATCSSCGHVHGYTKKEKKLYRPTSSEFKCQSCGAELDAQLNAANNVANQGKRMLDAGVPFTNWVAPKPHSVDKLVEKYKS